MDSHKDNIPLWYTFERGNPWPERMVHTNEPLRVNYMDKDQSPVLSLYRAISWTINKVVENLKEDPRERDISILSRKVSSYATLFKYVSLKFPESTRGDWPRAPPIRFWG